jgi:hypothetical protein
MALKNQPFKKLFGVLKAVAPTLLAATGSPLAPLAIGIAKRVMGNEAMTDEALEEAVASATGTSEGLAKLRAIEADLKKTELEQEFKFEELATDDRKDARARQVALKDNTPQIVLYLTSVGFFGVLVLLIFRGLPPTGDQVLMMMIGALGAAWGASVQYFVGSSSGSSRKTNILAEQATVIEEKKP